MIKAVGPNYPSLDKNVCKLKLSNTKECDFWVTSNSTNSKDKQYNYLLSVLIRTHKIASKMRKGEKQFIYNNKTNYQKHT